VNINSSKRKKHA